MDLTINDRQIHHTLNRQNSPPHGGEQTSAFHAESLAQQCRYGNGVDRKPTLLFSGTYSVIEDG
jgi:hypothetical protein